MVEEVRVVALAYTPEEKLLLERIAASLEGVPLTLAMNLLLSVLEGSLRQLTADQQVTAAAQIIEHLTGAFLAQLVPAPPSIIRPH